MLKADRHQQYAPWYILRSDDKKRARLNGIAHILSINPLREGRVRASRSSASGKKRPDDYAEAAGFRNVVPDVF